MNGARWMSLAAVLLCQSSWAQETHQHDHAKPSSKPTANAAEVSAHVPPAPPTHAMPEMSEAEMISVMEMDDAARFGKLMVNEAEWNGDDGYAWDVDAWYGGDYDKLWIKYAGEQDDARNSFAVDALWDHVFARWWSVQSGVRLDEVARTQETSLVLAIQGLAPQWFEVETSLYLSEHGTVSLHGELDYELLLTQRLVLEPSVELTAHSESDLERGIGSGLSDVEVSLRLRYEFRREIAPYVGVSWRRSMGRTADFARVDHRDVQDTRVLAGLRFWF